MVNTKHRDAAPSACASYAPLGTQVLLSISPLGSCYTIPPPVRRTTADWLRANLSSGSNLKSLPNGRLRAHFTEAPKAIQKAESSLTDSATRGQGNCGRRIISRPLRHSSAGCRRTSFEITRPPEKLCIQPLGDTRTHPKKRKKITIDTRPEQARQTQRHAHTIVNTQKSPETERLT